MPSTNRQLRWETRLPADPCTDTEALMHAAGPRRHGEGVVRFTSEHFPLREQFCGPRTLEAIEVCSSGTFTTAQAQEALRVAGLAPPVYEDCIRLAAAQHIIANRRPLLFAHVPVAGMVSFLAPDESEWMIANTYSKSPWHWTYLVVGVRPTPAARISSLDSSPRRQRPARARSG